MTDFESALITTIIDTKDIRTPIKMKVTQDFFFNTNARSAFIFLMQWYENPDYGDTPSWETFADAFQGFEPVRVEDSISAIVDKVRSTKLYSDLSDAMEKVGQDMAGDAFNGLATLKRLTVEMTASHTIDSATDVKNRVFDVREEYMMMKTGATGLKGKPYPWPALNDATLGLQNQQLVFVYGRPKAYKTWLLLEIARCLHEHDNRLLILSQELSDIEIIRRFIALRLNLDYNQFMRGCLPEQEEHDFLENLDLFVEQESVIVDRLTTMDRGCLTELQSKIQDYKPTVVLIDGINYLSTDWKELAEITRGLKRCGQNNNIPIIGSTHANRSRGKKGDATDNADDFAYGDAFYQTADLALRTVCDIENRKRKEVSLFTAAIRDGQSALFTVHTKLATDMSQKEVQKIGDADNDIDGEIDQDKIDGESDMRTEGDEGEQQ